MPKTRCRTWRRAGLVVAAACILAVPGAWAQTRPEAARSQRLPEGVEARPLPDEGAQAQPLPEGEPTQRAPDTPPAEPALPSAQQVVWEAKREGVEDRLRNTRVELEAARGRVGTACPTPDAEGCDAIRREVRQLEAQEGALAEYLETGILAECLRTQCDREWIRE